MKKIIIALTIAGMATSANAFFGDNNTGYYNGTADNTFDGRGRGVANGDMNAEGNFSMTINASGKVDSAMKADIDADSTNKFNSVLDGHNYSYDGYGVVPNYPVTPLR